MATFRPFSYVYVGLWLVRIWFALCGMGYIHPDEYMQNGEVTAGHIFGFHALTTWEWLPDMPVRSIIPTFLTTGLPLLALRLLFGSKRLVHPSLVFEAQRVPFLFLSGILDYSVLSLVSPPASRRLCLLLLASSYVTYTFQVRPFSNSIESLLVFLCLVLLRRIIDKQTRLKVGGKNSNDGNSYLFHNLKFDLHLLGILAVMGIFTRPTFFAFALPIGYQVLQLSFQVAASSVQAIYLLLPPFCTVTLAASVFIAADTYYFRGDFSKLVITPYNFVKYNLSTNNLAEHGLHPNWLHVGINLPMLIGPLFVWFSWSSIHSYVKPSGRRSQRVHFETDTVRHTLVQIVILSVSVLSTQPHQEPRFLIPLVPLIIMLASTAKFPRPGTLFWMTWITFNMVLALVFGILHQGGVVPSLFFLHSMLRNTATGSSTQIVYWKTYMPPRHLLGVSQWGDVTSGKISVTDLSGVASSALMAALTASLFNTTYLVTPVPMYLMLPQGISSCMALERRIFPHLDLDHIPESVQAGVRDGLSLGIYTVERNCIVDEIGDTGIFIT